MSYQKQLIVRFYSVKDDVVSLCDHTFKIMKPKFNHSQEPVQVIDEESYDFPKEQEFYYTLVSEEENIKELITDIKKDPNVETVFEGFAPAPPPCWN